MLSCYRKIFILFFVFLLSDLIYSGIGETGATFLKLGQGARALGIGSGYIAVADDVSAIYWNPGGLSQLKKNEISAMYVKWLDDIQYEVMGFAIPSKIGTFGTSFMFLHMGDIEKRGENRELLDETFTAYDMATTFSFSRELSQRVSMGFNIKIIHSKIENETATGIAFDFGILQKTKARNLQFGYSLKNLGSEMKFINKGYKLPLVLGGAALYNLFQLINITVSAEHYVYENKTDAGIGMELMVYKKVSFRGRYGFLENSKIIDLSKFGMGLGFNLSNYQIDYAFAPYENLGDVHRLSFTGRF